MKLYLISQDINDGLDTFDSAVVAAESEDDARTIYPSSYVTHVSNGQWMVDNRIADACCWVPFSRIDEIKVKYIGETEEERGVIIASFNAG